MRRARALVWGWGASLASVVIGLAPDARAAPAGGGAARLRPATPAPQISAGCPPRAALAAAVLTFVPKQRSADLWFVPLAGGAPAKVATVARAADTPVTAAAIAGTDMVAVVTSPRRARDLTWSGALLAVAPGQKPRGLLANVHAGGTPVTAPNDTIYVVRGKAGAERNPADHSRGYRRDTLELMAVDARSGAARVVSTDTGDALFLIGLLGADLVAYRVGAGGPAGPSRRTDAGGDFVAIDGANGAPRTLLSPAPALARDFSLDAETKTLWFTARVRSDAPTGKGEDRGWGVHRLDLASGKLTVVATNATMGLTPHRFPGGKVAYACAGDGESAKGRGLCVSGPGPEPERVARPLGAGRYEVQAVACTAEGPIAFGVRQADGPARSPFPRPFSWDVSEKQGRPLALPAGRVVFAGVVAASTPAAP